MVAIILISLIGYSPDTVDENFNFEVEVYCSLPAEDSSGKVSTPIKILKKLRHKVPTETHACNVSPLSVLQHAIIDA